MGTAPARPRLTDRRAVLEVGLGAARAGVCLLAIGGSAGGGPLVAHLALLGVALLGLAAVGPALRRGLLGGLGLSLTLVTLAAGAVHLVAWHGAAGTGSLVPALALLEAPGRYGVRGALLSVGVLLPVVWAFPTAGPSGEPPSTATSVALVVLLAGLAAVLHGLGERAARHTASERRRFEDVLTHLPVGVALLDREGAVSFANPALGALLPDVQPGTRLRDVLQQRGVGEAGPSELPGGSTSTLLRSAGGRWLRVGVSPLREAPSGEGWVAHVQDVTVDHEERRRLEHQARRDVLTGLLTRRAGEQVLEALSLTRTPASVLFVDLDGFKSLNDEHGHELGDAVLRETGRRLQVLLRAQDQAIRWGGDEFVLLLPGRDSASAAVAVAERLQASLALPYAGGLPVHGLRASVGICSTTGNWAPADVVAHADSAMYEAKRLGGGRCVITLAPRPADLTGASEQRRAGDLTDV